jgi:hypothetical protein
MAFKVKKDVKKRAAPEGVALLTLAKSLYAAAGTAAATAAR